MTYRQALRSPRKGEGMKAADCHRCGSAGSVEFGMCQVCYHDHTRQEMTTSEAGNPLDPFGGGGGPGSMEPGEGLLSLIASGREAEAATA